MLDYSDIFEKLEAKVPDETEMPVLIELLEGDNIPFDVEPDIEFGSRPHVFYPGNTNFKCSVICHWGSYGHEDGLLEIMGLTENEDGIEGWLTAKEVFRRIKEDWQKCSGKRE